ncbi:DoxX family protein [Larsenimonas salina]|uniref:DoxX family protein n=1 Tax=Larsenimonas salina TaxID=1295565 RepID=UPI002074033A|nr:DoxX family protein [Larsenimonas salina]MCM5705123.1 DoxX family protein [Larsenimonas salina]
MSTSPTTFTASASSDSSTSVIASHDIASLLLRLALGVMFIAHGLTKVLVWTLAGTGQFFESIGLPAWVAWPITGLELVGASMPHLGNGWMFTAPGGGWEYPAFLAVTALALSVLDGGKLTLPGLINRN